jgi:hypothetical protein
VVLGLISTGARATQYYVSTDGNDLNTGLSWAQAFATVGKGIDTASNDDVIDVNEGDYTGTLDFDEKAITIRSTDPNDWDVVANTEITATAVLFHSSEEANSVLLGCTIDGMIDCDGSGPTINKCIITAGIYCESGSSAVIENNKITGGIAKGIIIDSSTGQIRNNWIYDSDEGILLSAVTAPVAISNNTITDNADYGIRAVSCTAPNIPNISNCIIWDNDDDLSGCYASYSCIEDTFDVNDANYAGSINTDPCFVDADANNFHLDINSLCINAGDPDVYYYGQTDIDGEQRVYAEIVDMGADEATGFIYNGSKDKFYSYIQDAIDDANEGETLVVYPGSYSTPGPGSNVIDFDGKEITITGSEPDDWEVVAATEITSAVLFTSSEDANSVLTGCTIDNMVDCDGSGPIIKKCIITGGVDCSSGSSAVIENNKISNSSGNGALISGSAGAIRNNWIYDCSSNGILLYQITSAVEVSNNTVVGNSSAGIRAVSCTSPNIPDISNCVLWDNDVNDLAGCTATYSCIEDCNEASGTGNICGGANDPNFIDDANDNYHLQPDSPCVNAGDPSGDYAGQVDIQGERRVTDVNGVINIYAAVDIGSDEVAARVSIIIPVGSIYFYIQEAIDVAVDGDVIILQKGIYKGHDASKPEKRNYNLDFSNGLDEGTRAITVRSTDANDPEVVAKTVIDCENVGGRRGFNFHSGEDGNSVLSGVTIKNGGTSAYGGGIYCNNSSPKITNCVIRNNVSEEFGGGICCENKANPVFINCIIARNFALVGGGGMENYDATATLINCVFSENYTQGKGGGIHNYDATATLINCVFSENYITGSSWGGGIYNFRSDLTLINCTLCNNYSCYTSGIYNRKDSTKDATTELKNCILYGNGDCEIRNYSGTVGLKNCFIEYGKTTGTITYRGNDNIGRYSTDPNDPNFVAIYDPVGRDWIWGTEDDGLRLRTDSVCIDEGDNTELPADTNDLDEDENTTEYIPYDLTGIRRIADGNHAVEGSISATVDMGAYELPIIWYVVKGNSPQTEDGTSWTNAYDELQDALTNANIEDGNEIWVSDGTYIPDEGDGQTPDDRDSTFELIEGVAVYGGFEGDETAREDRDWTEHLTILSGDINDVDTDDSYHVVTGADGATVDGFTVTGGNADGSGYESRGGGIYCYSEWPAMIRSVIRNCVIEDNYADQGGGMYGQGCPSTVRDCVFSGNSADYGGGIYNIVDLVAIDTGGMVVTNCVFTGNEAENHGGGMYNYLSRPKVTNCTFYDNSADIRGGGMYNTLGSRPMIANSIFWGNTAVIEGDEIHNFNATARLRHCGIEDCGGSGNNWDSDFGDDLGGNIDIPDSVDPFDDSADPNGTDDDFMTSDDGLRLASDSPCIDAADGDFAPFLDILGLLRVDIPHIDDGVGVPDYVDIGAYEFRAKIVVMCWIDESEGSSPPRYFSYYWDSELYDFHLAKYRNLLDSLGGYAVVKSGCLVPDDHDPQETSWVLPEGYDAPDEINVEVCSRFPDHEDLTEMVEDFNDIRDGMVPDYLLLTVDDSDSMKLTDIWPTQVEYDAFIQAIKAICPNIVVLPTERRKFTDEAWVKEIRKLIEEEVLDY